MLPRGVVDLAADYRIKDIATWEQWYGMTHASPDWVGKAVYGLPEINRDAVKKAQLIANPGCYPTAVQLGFLPLIEAGVVDVSSLVADAKSGEAVKLVIVKKDPNLSEEDVRAFCKENLTGYKQPKVIEFRTELPKTPVGKILRRELREK